MNWYAVVHDVEVRLLEVDNFFPTSIFDPGITNVPFPWHRPIENFGTTGHFPNVQRYVVPYALQSFPEAVARDAPTDGEKLSNELEHAGAGAGIQRQCRRHATPIAVR